MQLSAAERDYNITARQERGNLGQVRDSYHVSWRSQLHATLHKPRVTGDKNAVSTLVTQVQGWNNPFFLVHNFLNCTLTIKATTYVEASRGEDS